MITPSAAFISMNTAIVFGVAGPIFCRQALRFKFTKLAQKLRCERLLLSPARRLLTLWQSSTTEIASPLIYVGCLLAFRAVVNLMHRWRSVRYGHDGTFRQQRRRVSLKLVSRYSLAQECCQLPGRHDSHQGRRHLRQKLWAARNSACRSGHWIDLELRRILS
jgi:hypothetical protein